MIKDLEVSSQTPGVPKIHHRCPIQYRAEPKSDLWLCSQVPNSLSYPASFPLTQRSIHTKQQHGKGTWNHLLTSLQDAILESFRSTRRTNTVHTVYKSLSKASSQRSSAPIWKKRQCHASFRRPQAGSLKLLLFLYKTNYQEVADPLSFLPLHIA